MVSLVMEFQHKMLDKNYNVTDLLRYGLIIANKLKSEDIKQWIKSEIYGYKSMEDVPEYRRVPMTLKFLNPVHGWCPIVTYDQKNLDILNNMKLGQSISEIEMLGNNKKSQEVHFDAPLIIKNNISPQVGFETDIHYICNSISLLGIVESVKNKLLEWILELEENGIVDDNMIFEKQQVEKAKAINTQIINNFYGDKDKIDVNQTIVKE